MNSKIIISIITVLSIGLLSLESGVFDTHNKDIGIIDGKLKGSWSFLGASNQPGSVKLVSYNQSNHSIKAIASNGIIWTTELDQINWTTINDSARIDDVFFFGDFNSTTQNIIVIGKSNNLVLVSGDTAKTWKPALGLEGLTNGGQIVKMIQSADSSFFLLSKEWDITSTSEKSTIYFSGDGAKSFNKIKSLDPNQFGPIENADLHSVSKSDKKAYLYFRDSLIEYDAVSGLLDRGIYVNPLTWGNSHLTGGRLGDSLNLHVHVGPFWYRSNGNATSWTRMSNLPFDPLTPYSYTHSLAEPNTLIYGNLEAFVSRNNGVSWDRFNRWESYLKSPSDSIHKDVYFINRFEKTDGTEFHLLASGGGLYLSENQFQSVQNISLLGQTNGEYYSSLTIQNDTMIFLGSKNQGLQKNLSSPMGDSMVSFNQIILGDFGAISSSDSGKTIWAINTDSIGIFLNPNLDTNYTKTFNLTDTIILNHKLAPILADPKNPNKAYLLSAYLKGDPLKESFIFEFELVNSEIIMSHRNFNFNTSGFKDEFISALSISNFNDSIWYALTDQGDYYYSVDAGHQWIRSSFFTGPNPIKATGSTIYASKSNEEHVYVAGNGYTNDPIHFSWNNGKDWRSFSKGLPRTNVYDLAGNDTDSLIFAATENGPFVYSKAEDEWFSLKNGIAPDQVYTSVEFLSSQNKARFTTLGRGIWDFSVKRFIDTTISISEFPKWAESIIIYPNPCVDQLQFKGHTSDYTLVSVYGISGELYLQKMIQEPSIDISQLPQGIFFLELKKNNGETIVSRFIKTKL